MSETDNQWTERTETQYATLARYCSADALAITLGLPKPYIRRLADVGQIPFLYVDGRGRRMFDEEHVREVLREIAIEDMKGAKEAKEAHDEMK